MELILKKVTVKKPTFREVKTNQQFIDLDGFLSVKYTLSQYVTLSDKNGEPFVSLRTHDRESDKIKLILPEIEKYVLPKC